MRAPRLDGPRSRVPAVHGRHHGRAPRARCSRSATWLRNTLQAAAWARPFFAARASVVVTPLPLYHIYSLTANLFCFMELGGHNLLITDPRDMQGLHRAAAEDPVRVHDRRQHAVQRAAARAGVRVDSTSRRCASCMGGGMAVQREVAERWQAVTGVPIAQGYGLTEASPIVTANPLRPRRSSTAPSGVPFPSTDVAIFDDAGAQLGVGEVGEICVRGPQVMAGYWQRPEETAQVLFGDGWLRTGDIGRLRRGGLLVHRGSQERRHRRLGLQGLSERDRGRRDAPGRRARSSGDRRAGRAIRRSREAVRRAQGAEADGRRRDRARRARA